VKKMLLASAITLTFLGFATNPAFAEENNLQTTTAETTQETTTTEKEKKSTPSTKEIAPSTETSSSLPTTSTTTTTTSSDKKEETKAPEVKKNGWVFEENIWRFYEANKPALNWKKIHGKWYYFDKNGIMLDNTIFDGYILTSSGAMVDSGWGKVKDKWYYAKPSGKISQQKWEKVGGVWYYFNKDASMANNQWQGSYYLKANGVMAEKEWIFDKNYNSWFYLKSGGAYAAREWIGSYYLKSGGYMAKSEWIDDSYYNARYYLDENGVYVTGTRKIDGKVQQFQSNGKWIGEIPVSRGFEKGKYTKTVFLDPGHGGRDPGAVYYNTNEKDLTMQVYKKLRKELEGLGYTVLSSRDSDVYVDFITERSKMVNSTNSDIFISIHFNASGNPASNRSGIQTYSYEEDSGYRSKINPYWHNHPDRISESNRLAADIHSSLLAETGAKDAGLLQSSFAVLRETDKPAVLLELGYIDNFNENQQIRSDAYQNRLVAGIVKGIQKYYAGK